jgi:hypothetical protein
MRHTTTDLLSDDQSRAPLVTIDLSGSAGGDAVPETAGVKPDEDEAGAHPEETACAVGGDRCQSGAVPRGDNVGAPERPPEAVGADVEDSASGSGHANRRRHRRDHGQR